MSHREVQVTFDCADPAALAGFWCEVLGYREQPPPSGFDSWDQALDAWGVPADQRNSRSAALPPEGDTGPRLFFQQVPESKISKNRLHLDVRAAPGAVGDERMAPSTPRPVVWWPSAPPESAGSIPTAAWRPGSW